MTWKLKAWQEQNKLGHKLWVSVKRRKRISHYRSAIAQSQSQWILNLIWCQPQMQPFGEIQYVLSKNSWVHFQGELCVFSQCGKAHLSLQPIKKAQWLMSFHCFLSFLFLGLMPPNTVLLNHVKIKWRNWVFFTSFLVLIKQQFIHLLSLVWLEWYQLTTD